MSKFVSSLKRLDIYRDIPKDLTEQTTTGAAVSIFTYLFLLYLFLNEFLSYLTINTRHEMFVNYSPEEHDPHATMQINFNITMTKMPCRLVYLEAQDIMGSTVHASVGAVQRYRVDGNGSIMYDEFGKMRSGDGGQPEAQIGDGCNVVGHLMVRAVPGNLHMGANPHSGLVSMYFPSGLIDCSHVVNQLWFGSDASIFDVKHAAIAPLSGAKKTVTANDINSGSFKSFEYFIKVIPTHYERLDKSVVRSFQYVANSNEVVGRFRMPAIFFRYDIEPIAVKFVTESQSFAHFIVQVCAIIGGVFTVLGIVSMLLKYVSTRFRPGAAAKAHGIGLPYAGGR